MKESLSLPHFRRISDFLFHHASATPYQEAIIFGGQRISYLQLAESVRLCARALIALGVARGCRVAVLSTPRPEHFIVFLAAASIGAIWVGLNPRHSSEELRFVVEDARPAVLFSIASFDQKSFGSTVSSLRNAVPGLHVVSIADRIDGATVSYEDFLLHGEALPLSEWQKAQSEVDSNDPVAVVYTSGSSGVPKGVILTHNSLVEGYLIQHKHWGVKPLRVLNNLPINHIASLGDLSLYSLLAGGTVVYMERFSADGALRIIEGERITFLQQFPTQFRLILDEPRYSTTDLSNLKVIAWGGAAVPRALICRLQETGAQLYNSYGLTECGGPVFFTDDDASIDTLADTVGRPDPAFEVRIVDDRGQLQSPGQPGEMLLHGRTFMSGYLNNPGETSRALTPEGWLRTGDVARCCSDGNYQLVGRIKDMYKSGGYSIYPREIETVLERHAEISMAAVIAVPDVLYQEVGHAFLVPKAKGSIDEASIAQYCRESMANYKVPKRFTFVDVLPTLPNGKVDKRALRRLVLEPSQRIVG